MPNYSRPALVFSSAVPKTEPFSFAEQESRPLKVCSADDLSRIIQDEQEELS